MKNHLYKIKFMNDIITSTSNQITKLINKLFDDKKYRDTSNLFVCQGKKIVTTLISLDFKLDKIIISQNSKYLEKFKYFDNAVVVKKHVYEYMSHQENGDGLIAVFNKKDKNKNLDYSDNILVFDNIQNPNNLGAILRTCTAFNIENIILANGSVDPYNFKVIQASMGYGLNKNIINANNLSKIIKDLQTKGYKVYATGFNKKAVSLQQLDVKRNKIAIIFGNEGSGLKTDQMNLCDQTVYIPINKKVDSLNLSNAVAIITYFIKSWK